MRANDKFYTASRTPSPDKEVISRLSGFRNGTPLRVTLVDPTESQQLHIELSREEAQTLGRRLLEFVDFCGE